MKPSLARELVDASGIAHTICAVMVTYNPDPDLWDRVTQVAAQVPQMVIVDNGSPKSCLEQIEKFGDGPGMHLIVNASNEGLASALNTGVRWAASQGFRWVLTLDQDTMVAKDMVSILTGLVTGYPFEERLAVVGSNFRDSVNGQLFFKPRDESSRTPYIETTTVLTSGSLISVESFQAIGAFRDDFFIDCIDHEFCLRARARGFRIIVSSTPTMNHEIGHMTARSLLWKKVRTPNHSPLREYFLTRNSILLVRQYLTAEPRWILNYLGGWLKLVSLILLLENNRTAKLKHIFYGAIDGFMKRTGPAPQRLCV